MTAISVFFLGRPPVLENLRAQARCEASSQRVYSAARDPDRVARREHLVELARRVAADVARLGRDVREHRLRAQIGVADGRSLRSSRWRMFASDSATFR